MWWALIEEISAHGEEIANEKVIACCVRNTMYTRIYWQQQLGKSWCVVAGMSSLEKFFNVKFYSRKIFSYTFCVHKNCFTTNYGNNYPTNCLPTRMRDCANSYNCNNVQWEDEKVYLNITPPFPALHSSNCNESCNHSHLHG